MEARAVSSPARKEDVRLPRNGDSNSHGARPFHQIITMIKWIHTSRLSTKISVSSSPAGCEPKPHVTECIHQSVSESQLPHKTVNVLLTMTRKGTSPPGPPRTTRAFAKVNSRTNLSTSTFPSRFRSTSRRGRVSWSLRSRALPDRESSLLTTFWSKSTLSSR